MAEAATSPEKISAPQVVKWAEPAGRGVHPPIGQVAPYPATSAYWVGADFVVGPDHEIVGDPAVQHGFESRTRLNRGAVPWSYRSRRSRSPPGAGLPNVLPSENPPTGNRNSQEKQRVSPATVKSPPGLNRPRTGLNALKARVKVKGLAAIDRRTSAARALLDWRRELLADLGGEPQVSAAQRALVELVVRTRLYVDHIDAHLMEMGSLVTRRGRVKPIVEQRQRLVDSLTRVLGQLGLERRAKQVTDLTAYVREKYATSGKPDGGAGVTAPPDAGADEVKRFDTGAPR